VDLRQLGKRIMPQGVLPYKYEEEKNDTGMTALDGGERN
jgi:hypothetical protein